MIVHWSLPSQDWSLPIQNLSVTIWSERGIWCMHEIPLYDEMVAQRFSVVFNQSFMISECRTMVFSSQRKVSLVFSSRRSLIVHNQSATSHRLRLPTSRRQIGYNRYKLEGLQRQVVGWSATGCRWAVIYVQWQYDKRRPFADRLWPTCHMTSPTLNANQKYCDCYPFLLPMVAGSLWWSPTILVVGGQESVLTQV